MNGSLGRAAHSAVIASTRLRSGLGRRRFHRVELLPEVSRAFDFLAVVEADQVRLAGLLRLAGREPYEIARRLDVFLPALPLPPHMLGRFLAIVRLAVTDELRPLHLR